MRKHRDENRFLHFYLFVNFAGQAELALLDQQNSIYFLCELHTCSLQTESISTGHCFICLTSYNQILVRLL